MLAIVYANGYLLHYDAKEKQEDLALGYARRAVAAEPSNPLAYYALSVSHVARKDIAAFLSAAEQALALFTGPRLCPACEPARAVLDASGLAMVHRQLGNRDAAGRSLAELLAIYPDFPAHARQEIEKFFYAQRAHAEHVIEGLRKAGLEIPGNAPVVETAVTSGGGSGPMPGDQAT